MPTVVDEQRRRLVGVAALGVGCLAVFGAGATAILGRLLHTSSASATTGLPAATTPPAPAPKPSPEPSSTQGGSTPAVPVQPPTGGATAPSTPTPAGTPIGPAHDVPVHGAASFQDPASGDPAIVVQPRAGTFLAFDAVCPHAGCTVTYTDANFFCPCHGSRFDGTTGAVEVGPARQGLRKIAISAGPDGTLYVS